MSLLDTITPAQIEKFWHLVDVRGPDDCWPWLGSLRGDPPQNYGRIMFSYVLYPSHRVAYALFTGEEIPPSLDGLHTCDNPPCCNPRHIFPGTDKTNMEDKVLKGRAATGIRNGKYTHPEKIQRGDQHYMRNGHRTQKLTRNVVEHIRSLPNAHSHRHELASEYGVSEASIRDILMYRTWK